MLASRQAGWAVGGEWTSARLLHALSLSNIGSHSTETHSPCCSSHARTAYATSTASAARRSSPAAASAAACRQQVARRPALRSSWGSRRSASYQLAASQRLTAAYAADAAQADAQHAAGELWRFLRQQGFSADGISWLQAAVRSKKTKTSITTGQKFTAQKLQRDLAPNIAALQAEGVDKATIERMCTSYHVLLTTTHATFSSSLAALRRLAALLPDDPRAVQAPAGATQLGATLWLYPTAAAYFLTRTNLASLIDGNLRLRRQLGFSDADTAAALFRQQATLVSNFERAEAMVAHLQHLQASGELSAGQGEHVAEGYVGSLVRGRCAPFAIMLNTILALPACIQPASPVDCVSHAAPVADKLVAVFVLNAGSHTLMQ